MRTVVVALAGVFFLSGCSNPDYDPDFCDHYRQLGAAYNETSGYTPVDIEELQDKYCSR